jgi:hypothetical protein
MYIDYEDMLFSFTVRVPIMQGRRREKEREEGKE